MSSLISFSNVLWFSLYKSFTSLVDCFPRYFILFDAVVYRIVFVFFFFFKNISLAASGLGYGAWA